MIHSPGARRFKKDALLEKLETASGVVPLLPSCVLPTLMTLEMQAGEASWVDELSLPEAAMVATFDERKLSIIDFMAAWAASQFALYSS